MNTLVPIERKEGITIYGRIIGPNNKLGQFEVHHKGKGKNISYPKYENAFKTFERLTKEQVKVTQISKK